MPLFEDNDPMAEYLSSKRTRNLGNFAVWESSSSLVSVSDGVSVQLEYGQKGIL